MGYNKLFGDIIMSTVWREEMHVKIVWITMLAMADRHGQVMASIPGLADAAKVSLGQCLEALECFLSPDEYSRTKEFEGRRISEVDGGWLLLNHDKFRERKDDEEQRYKTRERVKLHRERAREAAGMATSEVGYVYLAKILNPSLVTNGLVKIGYSKNPPARLSAEFGVNGFDLLATIPGDKQKEKEVQCGLGTFNSLVFSEYFNDAPELREKFVTFVTPCNDIQKQIQTQIQTQSEEEEVVKTEAVSTAPALEDSPKPKKVDKDAETVFRAWQEVLGHQTAKLDPKRQAILKNQLKMFSVEDLCRVPHGVLNSPWHMGDNPSRKQYHSIGLLYRDADQIEKFLDLDTGKITDAQPHPIDLCGKCDDSGFAEIESGGKMVKVRCSHL